MKERGFDYVRETRERYQSDAVATEYQASYTSRRGLDGARFRLIAARERAVVAALVRRVPHRTLLDLPAGTGKLAPVVAGLGSAVTAADVSPQMLRLAGEAYEAAGVRGVEVVVCDAEAIGRALPGRRFDVAVCLRLLHRVPPDVQDRMLAELCAVADHVVVSAGLDSAFQRSRRRVRHALFGGEPRGLGADRLPRLVARVERHGEILARRAILPLASSEVVFLVRARTRGPGAP